MNLSEGEGYPDRARWGPLLNRKEDRRRLEDLASSLPMVATYALPWRVLLRRPRMGLHCPQQQQAGEPAFR